MNLSIGLSGLQAAQRSIELVGTNLANAATEGYHRQRINLIPMEFGNNSSQVSTGGVWVVGSTRVYDMLLEREDLRLQPEIGQVNQELSALTTVEAVMGNLDNNPLADSLSEFFSALNDLSSDPTQAAYIQSVVWSADALCTNFRTMADYLTKMKEQLVQQTRNLIEEINTKAQTVANLNHEIELANRRGVSNNLLLDQRDQALLEMSQLADVQITGMGTSNGEVCVYAWGTPLVLNSDYTEMSISINESEELCISVQGMDSYTSYASGGQIGGLIQLYNELLPDLQNRMNSLAQQVMYELNNLHAQGLGLNGSFTELTGTTVNTMNNLSDWTPPVSDGTLCLRLMDADGNATVHEIHVAADQKIDFVLDQINLISPGNLSANTANGAIYLQAQNSYTFDFLPTYSNTTAAVNETLTGRSVDDLRDTYFTGDDAADQLDFDLGGSPAEQFAYAIGNGSKTLYEVVQDINTWSQSVHDGWQAASAVWDDSSGGFRLQLDAWDYTGAGNITMANTGNVTWGDTGDPVQVAAGDFEAASAQAVFGCDVQTYSVYTGENQTFTFRVVHPDGPGNSGDVGITLDLSLEVYNESSELVKVLPIGQGYAAGDRLKVVDGMEISFGTGTLTDGDEFTVTARSASDESMFLTSAGLNTFLAGNDASDIKVRPEFYDNPFLFASCLDSTTSDNLNISRIANLQDTKFDGLGGLCPMDYATQTVTTLGQQVALREARSDALDAIQLELKNQRDLVSGVDVDEEAANLLVFERMFQAMSKFIATQNKMLEALMDAM